MSLAVEEIQGYLRVGKEKRLRCKCVKAYLQINISEIVQRIEQEE